MKMFVYRTLSPCYLLLRHSSQSSRCVLGCTFSENDHVVQQKKSFHIGTYEKAILHVDRQSIPNNSFFRGLRHRNKVISGNDEASTVSVSQVFGDLVGASKPNRKPSHIRQQPTEVVSQSFTVSNVETERENVDETSKPKTKKALDIALKIRESEGKKNSSNNSKVELTPTQRSIKNLAMPILDKIEDADLARLIRRNVIYADKKVVIFNKPYGLPMHDGDNISQNIKNVLPMVSKMVYGVNTNIPLNICNRLDKYTTGISITTTDVETSRHVMKLMREHQVIKKYWVVALGVPDPPYGIVDIPMDYSIIGKGGEQSYTRMVVKPRVRFDNLTGREIKTRSRGMPAITHYKLLDFSSSLSLIELQPQTTLKHQLRVHMADGLACPILGDHKYSHNNKLAPQNLPWNILKRFGIPRTKSRYTPMHLHLQSVLIPGIFPDQAKPNLVLRASLPVHMARTMKMFGLKPGVATEWNSVNRPSGDRTAKPLRDNCSLYFDPTTSVPTVEDDSRYDLDNTCVKAFRKSNIRVKYLHK